MIDGNKIFFEFDPFDLANVDAPTSNLREAKKKIADLVLEEVLNYVGKAESPVSGERWKASLSPKYKKFKSKYSSNLTANMELHGDMLDSLECVVNRGGNLELRITGRSQSQKADGHNNHSGASTLPQRRFIPDGNQTFKKDILEKIKVIAEDYQATEGDNNGEDV